MSYFVARIAAAFLVMSLAVAGGWASTAVLPLQSKDKTSQTVYTSYWPLIQIRSIAESKNPQPSPSLQNTGGGPVSNAPIYPESEPDSTITEVAERIAREVYVQGKFILPITQQPEDKNNYVSTKPGMLTQFGMAARNGVTGLLAHNYLSGDLFYLLDVGQEIDVLYADGQIRHYRISQILSFQKLHPSNWDSDYLDVHTGKLLSTSEVFRKVYRGEPHLTLQTCLEQNGDLSWGLYFVIAVPLQKT